MSSLKVWKQPTFVFSDSHFVYVLDVFRSCDNKLLDFCSVKYYFLAGVLLPSGTLRL